jgi:hypothetical protein
MPDDIKFAFVQTENLNRKFFKVPQAMVHISVTGAENPLTHQRMRDAVSRDFAATQKKVNDFIRQRDLQISRLGVNERKRQKATLIKTGNESIQRFLADFQKSAEATLAEFAREQAAKDALVESAQQTENWRTVRWVFSVGWTGVKAIGGLVEAVSTGGTATPLVIKDFVDNLVDLKKLFDDMRDHYTTLTQARERVKNSLAALKSKSRFTNSDVEAFANDLKLYEAKLLAMEVQARSISTKINAALSAMPKSGVKPKAVKVAENALDNSIKELIECSKSIQAAETYLATLKKNLGTARATAKQDPTLTAVKNWAIAAYSKINDFKDIVLNPAELSTWIDAAVKIFGDTRNLLEA